MADILTNNHANFDRRSFTFVDYGRIDSGLAPAGKSVGALCCTDYLSDWEGLSRDAYRRKKDEVAMIFMERLEKILPGISRQIDYMRSGNRSNRKALHPYSGRSRIRVCPGSLKTTIRHLGIA
jgi:all-trans-retinol 13,14-reductase